MNFGGGFEIATATFCGLAMTIFEQIPRLRPRAFLPAPIGNAGTGAKARTGAPLGMTEESGLCLG